MCEYQNYTGSEKHHIAPFEVVVHNQPTDCWISFLGKVFNITSLIEEFCDKDCVRPLIEHAGKDVSHWFDQYTDEICHYVHPVTGVRVPYCPHGALPHVPPQVPSTQWQPIAIPWWRNYEKYQVGLLTKRVRPVRIINTIICKETMINVCCEDSIYRIAERYSMINSDGLSYIWRFSDKTLDMEKNLEENGIIDERDTFTNVGLPQSLYVPGLFLYYKDDMKYEAPNNS